MLGVIFLMFLSVMQLAAEESVKSSIVDMAGQAYVDAREKMLDVGAVVKSDGIRSSVVLRSIAIRKALPDLSEKLLMAERLSPGAKLGRMTSIQYWVGEVDGGVKSLEDRVFLMAEALIFVPFTEWDERRWGHVISHIVTNGIEVKDMDSSVKIGVFVEVANACSGPQYVEELASALRTNYYHFETGLDLLKGMIFGVKANYLPCAIERLTRYGARQRRDQWDEKYLRQSLDRGLEIIEAIAADAVVRNRADVLVQLADGIRTRGLPLLDFGQYFDQPVGARLNAAISKAAQSFANDPALQKAVTALAEAIAAYPASKEHAFLPDSPKDQKQP
jgi:hypothetical protein